MTATQWIKRQANLPPGYSPEAAKFEHPSGATATLHRQADGSWAATAVHDQAIDECWFSTWDVAMEQLRRSGYRVPAPPGRVPTFANRLAAIRTVIENGYQPVFVGGARV